MKPWGRCAEGVPLCVIAVDMAPAPSGRAREPSEQGPPPPKTRPQPKSRLQESGGGVKAHCPHAFHRSNIALLATARHRGGFGRRRVRWTWGGEGIALFARDDGVGFAGRYASRNGRSEL
jgi:hypothetical protein